MFWTSDKTWYKGSLAEFSASSGRHLCEYDDGDRQWIDLAQEKYELDEGTLSRLLQRGCDQLIGNPFLWGMMQFLMT